MAQGIQLRRADTIFNEVKAIQDEISRRAYEFFRTQPRGPLGDWLSAEHELVWRPAIELRQKDGEFEILAAVPGVDAKDLDVQVTPEDVLIKAQISHEHTPEKGSVQVCEFEKGNLFRTIHLPQRIDPDTAQADYRNGMLHVTASIAKEAAAKKVEIQGA